MSHILLINPNFGKNRSPNNGEFAPREPLSILALASYVKKAGIEVKLIDVALYKETYVKRTISDIIVKGEKPLLIGFSVMTAQISHALELSSFVKGLSRYIPVVWGGVHPTFFPKETSLDNLVDVVVHGRGEIPLLEICKQLIKEQKISNDIPGTCIKGKLNTAEKIYKTVEYPWFDYELLDIKRYIGPLPHYLLSENGEPNRSLQVLSSRGCPWRCAFCINKATQNRWTSFNAERYLDELEANIKRFRLDAYRVMDEDFFVNKRRTFEIVEGLIKRGINLKWGTNIRANYFRDNYVNIRFAKKLRSSGCSFLSMGAESGSQNILNLLKKDITVQQLIYSAEVCNEAGITPIYSWMSGIPTQTKEEIVDTIDLMKKISRICPSASHYRLFPYMPYPGGSLYDLCVEYGLQVPETLRGWSQIEDKATGYYSIDSLPWVKEPRFIEFVYKYASMIPSLLNKSLKHRILARWIYSIIAKWDTAISRTYLFSLQLFIRIIRYYDSRYFNV